METRTIVASWTGRVVARARARGLDIEPLLRDVGISEAVLADPHGRVPYARHEELLVRVVAALGDPGFGVDVGSASGTGDFGVVALLAESRPTLREALDTVQRYNALANEASLMEHWVEGDHAFIRDAHYRDGRPMPAPVAEATLAFYAATIRRTCPARRPFVEVRFAHARHDGWTGQREACFGAPLRFDAQMNALVLAREVLELPFVSARPELSTHLVRLAEHLEDELPPTDDLVARVAAEVRRALARGGPRPLSQTARALRTSARTLQRGLEQAGRSYKDIVDDVRRETAHTLLTDSDEKLEVIAERLGYAELRSFRRACMRWFGRAPGELRRARA